MDDNFWKCFCCAHSVTTEADENGDAICLRCGAVIQIKFNMKRFKEYLKRIRRDDGGNVK